MKCLVTGGAGFVGSAVVEELLRQRPEANIVVLDSFVTGRRAFLPATEQVQAKECDIRDKPGVDRVVEEVRPTHVIHLAALHFIPYCNSHPSETVAVNIGGTQHLIDACKRYPPLSMVSASSAAVYPVNDQFNREDEILASPSDIYGITKWCNEAQLEVLSNQIDTKCSVARISNVYGPRETNAHLVPEVIVQMLSGARSLRLGNISSKRDFIYVTDVAKALVAMALHNEHGFRAYNVATGDENSVDELVAILNAISQQDLQIETDPAKVRKSDRPFLRSDVRRTRDELGFEASVSLQDGLKQLWSWARSNVSLCQSLLNEYRLR